jgi:hypothetical protein
MAIKVVRRDEKVYKRVYIINDKFDKKPKLRVVDPDKPNLYYIPIFREDLESLEKKRQVNNNPIPDYQDGESYQRLLHRLCSL